MPKKIDFEKFGNSYVYEVFPIVIEQNYQSYISLPIDIGREVKGKKVKVSIEVLD